MTKWAVQHLFKYMNYRVIRVQGACMRYGVARRQRVDRNQELKCGEEGEPTRRPGTGVEKSDESVLGEPGM